MAMNEDTIKGKWLEIKGEVQKAWGKLTSDELEQTKGDAKAIAGLVQQKYGKESENFQDRYSEIVKSVEGKRDAAVKGTKDGLKS